MDYIRIFFIYSILGFIYETLLALVLGNTPNSGFLYGPWTPIYGIGALLILIISKYIFKKLYLKKIYEIIIFFFTITIVLTIIEFSSGHLINMIFNKDLWNYSDIPLHIGKYIALPISFGWGLASLFTIYVIHPIIKKILSKIPEWLIRILIFIILIDFLITVLMKVP